MLTSNSKLKKSGIYGFGLTPGITCVGCRVNCYALKDIYSCMAKTMVAHWDRNLVAAQSADFNFDMSYEIVKTGAQYVRIHPEGDFFSQEYFDKWCSLARSFPDVMFYAYTKALHLDFSAAPANFKIVQSIGGEYDHLIDYNKPHARIFATTAELNAAGYAAAYDDDIVAADPSTIKIGLLAH